MKSASIALFMFALFAFGLPIFGMQTNSFQQPGVHGCIDECYESWRAQTGGILAVAQAQAAARAEASPAELGEASYAGCIACHGAAGEGGIGPRLAGQSAAEIVDKLLRYKKGETIGSQSNLMWAQAGQLSDADIDNLGAFVESLQ